VASSISIPPIGTSVGQQRRRSHKPIDSVSVEARKGDRSAIKASLFYGVVMTALVALQYTLNGKYSALPFFCLFAFFCHLTKIRKSISDPFTIVLLFAFIYSAFPLFFGRPASWTSLHFDFDGAAIIYSVGSISMIFSVAFAIMLIREKRPRGESNAVWRKPNGLALRAGFYSSILSLVLSAAYLARSGSVLLGQVSYADSFQVKMQAGSGLLMLSVPLAGGGIALMLTSHTRLRLYHHLLGLAAYGGLYFVHAQRRFLIVPAVFYLARYLVVKNMTKLVVLILICMTGLVVFMYLGFMRTERIAFTEVLDSAVIDRFAKSGGESFAGESVGVFATATAAHDGFVTALPYGADYWKSWMMCLPYSYGGKQFMVVNERFAMKANSRGASKGQGYGFSFFGEAFMVGGYPMVAFATFLVMLLFRWLYIIGFRDQGYGLLGAISLSALPFTFWFQRSALAYLVKEFLFLQIGTIVLAYVAIKLLTRQQQPSRKRGVRRRLAPPESLPGHEPHRPLSIPGISGNREPV
jgi:hypothetical protein